MYIAKERFEDSRASVDQVTGTYIHELGNILGYKGNIGPKSGAYTVWGDPRGIGVAKDTDNGANFQKCVNAAGIDF